MMMLQHWTMMMLFTSSLERFGQSEKWAGGLFSILSVSVRLFLFNIEPVSKLDTLWFLSPLHIRIMKVKIILCVPYSTQYRTVGRYQILTKYYQILTKIIQIHQHIVFFEKACQQKTKAPAASLKRSKHGLGRPKHAFSQKGKSFFSSKKAPAPAAALNS